MSKELEAFNRIKSYFHPKQLLTKEKTLNDLDTIEKALKEYEGAKNHIEALHKERVENSLKLKALEIIKEHTLYCENVDCFVFVNITKEVNDLLKEVLL